MDENQRDIESQIQFARLFMRKDRPLPPSGCSVAFFVFLGLLTVALIVMYIIYKQQ